MAPLTPLATPADLATRLNVAAPAAGSAEEAHQMALLEDASNELRAITGQPLNRLTSTVVLFADRHGQVELPASPVVSVDAVSINDGAPLATDDYTVRYNVVRSTLISRDDAVEVTFVHGWDPIPGELIKWACVLAAAAKAAADTTGGLGMTAGIARRQESIDDYSTQTDAPSGSQDAAMGMALPPRIEDRIRAAYGGGSGIEWLEQAG